jgi:hypothetical protein
LPVTGTGWGGSFFSALDMGLAVSSFSTIAFSKPLQVPPMEGSPPT